MRTEIALSGLRASIEDGAWTTDNPWLALALPLITLEDDGYEPDLDYALAVRAVALLGGAIVAYDGPPALPVDAVP